MYVYYDIIIGEYFHKCMEREAFILFLSCHNFFFSKISSLNLTSTVHVRRISFPISRSQKSNVSILFVDFYNPIRSKEKPFYCGVRRNVLMRLCLRSFIFCFSLKIDLTRDGDVNPTMKVYYQKRW